MFGGHRTDVGILRVRERCKIGKQSKDVVDCDKAHSLAQSCEERGTTQLPLIFYLREWSEAWGVLRSIDLEDGSLAFKGFTVLVSPSLSTLLPGLHALVGHEVSIIRTDSIRHPLVVRVRARKNGVIKNGENGE